ncbi:MAG TPA: corrinoid protein [Candidatus Limnocylindrales bacterium]
MADLAALTEAVSVGNRAAAADLTRDAVDDGTDPQAILTAMTTALDDVGRRFARGELFVPEMLIAARAMKAGMAILEPVLAAHGARPVHRAVLGTVEGDLHDIGKNLVAMMWRGAGIEVFDLGVGVSPERFAQAAREHDAQLVGVSALLTTTMPSMRDIVVAVRESGLPAKVVVGGAPVTAEYAAQVGADGFAPDASAAVELARQLLGA